MRGLNEIYVLRSVSSFGWFTSLCHVGSCSESGNSSSAYPSSNNFAVMLKGSMSALFVTNPRERAHLFTLFV